MRIWKWPLAVTDSQTVHLPAGADILTVQMQGDECCLWALCDERAQSEPRRIVMYGTGHLVPAANPGNYIATFQMAEGRLVFHAFEVPHE